ncbi:MAG TPA: DUF1634 domain-containing protein [Acidimicrobiales bacterium]|nr:DUF1634 domain-containing protein [Acidimicrobiales bacterium]
MEGQAATARLEGAVALVLRVGVTVSCAVMGAGAVVTLVAPRSRRETARAVPALRRGVLHPAGTSSFHSIGGVLGALAHDPGPALVMLGVLLLVATPVARVAVSVVGYALEGDRRFVSITLIVLAVLVASFAIG